MMPSATEFEAMVSAHYEPLFRFAMSLTHAESDACDLTQQTFYIWATKRDQLRDISKAKGWLFTTLHRTFLAAQRRQVRFPQHQYEEVSMELPAVAPDFARYLDSSQVLAALARVDEVFRPAVALFYLEDCSYKEISEILAVPVGTVKSRIARGIAQLRGLFGFIESGPTPASVNAEPNAGGSQHDSTGHPCAREPTSQAQGFMQRAEWDLSSILLREPFGSS